MVAYLPLPGGHIKLAERFVDPAFSFTMVRTTWITPHAAPADGFAGIGELRVGITGTTGRSFCPPNSALPRS